MPFGPSNRFSFDCRNDPFIELADRLLICFCCVRSMHTGHGTRRVTKNRPSDVCTNRVPIVGYQSSSKISTWSTQADSNFVIPWMLGGMLVTWPSSSSLCVNLWSGKFISKILDRDRSTSAQMPSCLILNLFKSLRYGEFKHVNEISLSLKTSVLATYSSMPVCQSFQCIFVDKFA